MKRSLPALILVVVLPLFTAVSQDSSLCNRAWHTDIQLEANTITSRQMPFSIEIDFGALLHAAGAGIRTWSVR